MANDRAGGFHRDLDLIARSGGVAGLGDAELLRRFVHRRGDEAEAAFEAIVARHGPMVLGVCRGVLRHPVDADDAFQATFLILIRKAGSVRVADSLAPWLYGVARRVASKAGVVARKRLARETTGVELDEEVGHVADEGPLDDRPILFEELDRLPEKYRSPVVLCHFEGLSHQEAALRLRWPVGTLSGRLSRARDLLRSRLARRGLSMAAAHVAGELSATRANAIPPALLRLTARIAATYESGGPLPNATLSLARGVLTAMLIHNVKLATSVGAILALVAVAAGFVAGQIGVPIKPGGEAGARKPEGREAVAARKPEELAKARLELTRRSYEQAEEQIKFPPAGANPRETLAPSVDNLALWSRRWMEAERDMDAGKAARLAALDGHIKRLKTWEDLFERIVQGQQSGEAQQSLDTLKFHRLEADYWLAKEKSGNQ